MNRRGFLAGLFSVCVPPLLLPDPTRRIYSFLWGDRRLVESASELWLVTDQVDPSLNGLYRMNHGTWGAGGELERGLVRFDDITRLP